MKHKVTFIGAGYVGIVNALGMASRGIEVWLVDNVEERINSLQKGVPPIYEEGIESYFSNPAVKENIHYTTRLEEALRNTDYVFIAVGTPQSEDGSADLSAVHSVARAIGQKMDHPMTVVVKSTVPVGTTRDVENIITDELMNRSICFGFGVANNPEFLKEGHAFCDFNHPDRIVIGTHYDDDDVRARMLDLYLGMGFDIDVIQMCSIQSSELIKYASNSMLAMRISFANMMADMCVATGADIVEVMTGVGGDHRIGPHFLQAGIGYGGSCFPKDVASLKHQMENAGVDHHLLDATDSINRNAKDRPFEYLVRNLRNLKGKTIAIWGGAFKEGTDDIRESPFLDLIRTTRAWFNNVTFRVYDELAGENIRKFIENPDNHREYIGNNRIIVADTLMGSVEGADAILLMTPTQNHRGVDFNDVYKHTGKEYPIFLDCRNFYDYEDVAYIINARFRYASVGRQIAPKK